MLSKSLFFSEKQFFMVENSVLGLSFKSFQSKCLYEPIKLSFNVPYSIKIRNVLFWNQVGATWCKTITSNIEQSIILFQDRIFKKNQTNKIWGKPDV